MKVSRLLALTARAQRGTGWDVPMLALVATFLLTVASAPFEPAAAAVAFLWRSQVQWTLTTDQGRQPGAAASVDYLLTGPQGLVRWRADGDYAQTPELVLVAAQLVEPSRWEGYRRVVLAGNLDGTVPAGAVVLDRRTAQALGVDAGGRVVLQGLADASGPVPDTVLTVGAVVPSYADPVTRATGLLAISRSALAPRAARALTAGAASVLVGGPGDPAPPGSVSRATMMRSDAQALAPLLTGGSSAPPVLLGLVLWLVTLRRVVRRSLARRVQVGALFCSLGATSRRVAAATALLVGAAGSAAALLAALLTDRAAVPLVLGHQGSALALAPLVAPMLLLCAAVAAGGYLRLRRKLTRDRLVQTLTEAW